LGYGAELVESGPLPATETGVDLVAKNVADEIANDAAEGRVLKQLLAINGLMFLVEIGAGWLAHSAGLVADAMDMFADATVYGVALYGVGRAIHIKLAAARLAGLFQFLLALAALATSVRHILLGAEPVSMAMIGIGGLALLANVACLLLIYRHRHGGIHMQASYIFSATDVIANLGVIVAGLLVIWSGNAWPDWIVGLMIGSIVLIGAVRILRLR
jgi:Co/Zn/Cd efflux system component